MYRVLVTQLIVNFFLAFVFFFALSLEAAMSAMVGGFISIVANAYMIYRCFYYSGAKQAKQILFSFYKGEFGKFLLTLVGFSLVFLFFKSVMPVALFCAYVIVQLVSWFTPLIIGNNNLFKF